MGRFPRWNIGLQGRIALYVIGIVVSVLSIATTASRLLIERQARLPLREECVTLVPQVGAGIGILQELRGCGGAADAGERFQSLPRDRPLLTLFSPASDSALPEGRGG